MPSYPRAWLQPKTLTILGSCEPFGYCPVKLRDEGSIWVCRKCHCGPDLGKDRVYVLDSLWNDKLLEFRVFQPGFLLTLGWKIPTCVALNMTDRESLLHFIPVITA